MPDRTQRITDLIRQLLDRNYANAVSPVINAIVRNGSSGMLAKRVADLEREARRLADLGQQLSPDSAVVRALLADLEGVLKLDASLISGVAPQLQTDAYAAAGRIVRETALPGFSDRALRMIGVAWNTPNPEAVAQLIDYVNSAAFAAKLDAYVAGTVEAAQRTAINAFVNGWGPARAAQALTQAVQGLPAAYAQQFMRTLQLTTLRDAQRVHRVANAGILEYQIRIAALDGRTCMSCIALHGQVLPIDARIDDHHNGRCTSITKVSFLDAPTVTGGPEWFYTLPEDQQRSLAGNALYDAFKAGAVQWGDMSRSYTDDLFGNMIGEASLKGILGANAAQYYRSK